MGPFLRMVPKGEVVWLTNKVLNQQTERTRVMNALQQQTFGFDPSELQFFDGAYSTFKACGMAASLAAITTMVAMMEFNERPI